ncbi:hypothetical protein [Pedobacter jamesrossensis]|uniref:Uncharacterized protein n=1 Tax=Pedobacter jamesrossensis TaxID=1908238 RepID=A0ABV8NQ18_9SPHI
MHILPGTDTRIINLEGTIIIITAVKDDVSLYRVMIDGLFYGYVQRIDGVLHRLDGSKISNEFFSEICRVIQ